MKYHEQIKAGGSIPKQGQRIILSTDKEHIIQDLERDVLKSDTAAVYVMNDLFYSYVDT